MANFDERLHKVVKEELDNLIDEPTKEILRALAILNEKRKTFLQKQIQKGCDKCSQWDDCWGCDKCDFV